MSDLLLVRSTRGLDFRLASEVEAVLCVGLRPEPVRTDAEWN